MDSCPRRSAPRRNNGRGKLPEVLRKYGRVLIKTISRPLAFFSPFFENGMLAYHIHLSPVFVRPFCSATVYRGEALALHSQCFVKEILVELLQPSFLHLRLNSGLVVLTIPLLAPPFEILPYYTEDERREDIMDGSRRT